MIYGMIINLKRPSTAAIMATAATALTISFSAALCIKTHTIMGNKY